MQENKCVNCGNVCYDKMFCTDRCEVLVVERGLRSTRAILNITPDDIDKMDPGVDMDHLIISTILSHRYLLIKNKQWESHSIIRRDTWLVNPQLEISHDIVPWCQWNSQTITRSAFMGNGPFYGWSTNDELALDVINEVGCGDVWRIITSSEGTFAELIEKRIFMKDRPEIKSEVLAIGPDLNHFALAVCRTALKQYYYNEQ